MDMLCLCSLWGGRQLRARDDEGDAAVEQVWVCGGTEKSGGRSVERSGEEGGHCNGLEDDGGVKFRGGIRLILGSTGVGSM